MIDFRYHIVSLTAVFLALAVGVVLGTTALKGPILDDLRSRVNSLAEENRSLRQDVRELKDQVGKQDSFADEIAPALLPGRLRGHAVAVISGPGGQTEDRDAMVADLGRAGGKVVSRVRLANDFTDPKRSAELKALVAQLLPAGVQIPETADGAGQAGRLLAAVLTDGGRDAPVAAASRAAVLQGFKSLGLLAVDGEITQVADLALVLASPPATGAQAEARNASMLGFLREFDTYAKATVVAAATATGDGNVIAAVRGDDRLAKTLTTVDDIGRPASRIAAVLALAAEARGRSGQYGVGDGASGRVPSLTS